MTRTDNNSLTKSTQSSYERSEIPASPDNSIRSTYRVRRQCHNIPLQNIRTVNTGQIESTYDYIPWRRYHTEQNGDVTDDWHITVEQEKDSCASET